MYSVIDIESNGAAFRKESIIEIAIYRYDGHEIVDQFISMVNPEAEISSFVQKLTGITPKMVKTAPKFHEIAKRVIEITADTTMVGHNIEFDYRMLRQSYARLGYEFKINTLDTIPLAQKLLPDSESYSLGKLVKSLGIPLTEHHRAGGDARATLDLFKLLIDKDKDKEIIQAQFDITNAKTYVNKVRELTQDLPAEKALIYFQDAQGKILYTDYADDIYRAAKQLFNSKSRRSKPVQEETEKISYEFAGTDIIAKLMLRNQNIHKKVNIPFALFYSDGKFSVEKLNPQSNSLPLLRFRSFSQGQKALDYIVNDLQVADDESLNQKISLKQQSVLLIGKGRRLGEKSFLYVERGRLKGYGFYEFFNQIATKASLKKLLVPATATQDIVNDIRLGLLRGDFEILPLPKS